MAWTYSGNPGFSAKDAIRFAVADTDKKRPVFTDEEITYCIAQNGTSLGLAAIQLCDNLIAQYARLADETVGRVSIAYSEMQKGAIAMRGNLQQRLMFTEVVPYAGGISVSDIAINVSNTDRQPPLFTTDQLQTPGLAAGDFSGSDAYGDSSDDDNQVSGASD